jgi:transcription elongation factor Elf1
MASTGFPGDSDPRDEEPEFDCPMCGNTMDSGKYWVKCEECGFSDEADVEPPSYSDYSGPYPGDDR